MRQVFMLPYAHLTWLSTSSCLSHIKVSTYTFNLVNDTSSLFLMMTAVSRLKLLALNVYYWKIISCWYTKNL